jgi:ribonuclease HII
VVGVDEAGRGPLAGPVVAAAVVLGGTIDGLADSKKLTPKKRDQLAADIRERSVAWSVAWADPSEIDAMNILHATMLAMRRAILGIRVPLQLALVDGNRLPNLRFGQREIAGEAIVKGDATVSCISAASILAKTCRDQMMCALHEQFPAYGFATHKGYPTAAHQRVLESRGPCSAHRRSFEPVRRSLEHFPIDGLSDTRSRVS